MIADPWIRRARLERVIDGDTVRVLLDFGYATYGRHAIRLLGVDAPEIFSGTAEERAAGQRAREFVVAWLATHAAHDAGEPDWPLIVQSEKDRQTFNRYLGVVTCRDGHDLGADLIAAGLAAPGGA